MNKLTAMLAVATVALLLPSPAAAKGPASGTISGPGLGGPIQLARMGEGGSIAALGLVVEHGGFFSAIIEDGRLAAKRPAGDLGPRYTVVYSMGGDGTEQVRQTVYPYARPFPVTYMAAGQTVFGQMKTIGGWYVGNERLLATLVEAGLPRTPPMAAAAPSAVPDDSLDLRQPLVLGAALAAAFALAAASALLLRRRRLVSAR